MFIIKDNIMYKRIQRILLLLKT